METPSTEPRVSVVIPTWNRYDLVTECLRSLAGQTFRDFETIVVDDGSTDGTPERLAQDFPEVHCIPLETNRRFAAAVNTGIRAARGTWVFLLNNDVTLKPDCLKLLVERAEAARVSMAAPLILWRNTPEIVYSAGDRIGVNGRPESIGFRQPLAGFAFPDAIFGVSAAAGLYHRNLFDTCGLLDECFVAYFEDSDLCYRARLAGFEAVLVPEAVAYHVGSASIEKATWWRSAQCFRNHAFLVIKNTPGPLFIRYWPRIVRERAHQLRSMWSAARAAFGARGALKVTCQTALEFFQALPHILPERRRIQRTRKISLAELHLQLWKGKP